MQLASMAVFGYWRLDGHAVSESNQLLAAGRGLPQVEEITGVDFAGRRVRAAGVALDWAGVSAAWGSVV